MYVYTFGGVALSRLICSPAAPENAPPARILRPQLTLRLGGTEVMISKMLSRLFAALLQPDKSRIDETLSLIQTVDRGRQR